MRILIIGYGIQGRKRHRLAQEAVVGIVDPLAPEAQYKTVDAVPLSTFDIAFLCVPDPEKIPILIYLLSHQKPTLVEKPLLFYTPENQAKIQALSQNTPYYTAYNHRFEPHVQSVKTVLAQKSLGKIYTLQLFYGNGTAADVRASPWRDQGYGVVQDLGSHLLDLVAYWEPDFLQRHFTTVVRNCFENQAPDQAILHAVGQPYAQLSMSLLSWKNTFLVDIWGEKGSVHINGLCKWGPSAFSLRYRTYPSGKPREENVSLLEPDQTWEKEYQYFLSLIASGTAGTAQDSWIEAQL